MPKLDGQRVALRGRVYPDTHQRAHEAAVAAGMSLSEYLAMLIDRDTLGRTYQPATRAVPMFSPTSGDVTAAAA